MNIPEWTGEHVLASFFTELEKISFLMKQDLPNVGTAPAMVSGPAIGSDPTAKPKIPGAMKVPKPKGLKMPSMSGGMKMPRARVGKM
jgi:hypothetical protein